MMEPWRTFREATLIREVGPLSYETEVLAQWQQGRSAFGGVVFGVLARAALASESDPARALRTFACDVAAPVLPGRAEITVRVRRRGRSVTNLALTLSQGGRVAASALATLGAARPAAPAPSPVEVPREALSAVEDAVVLPLGPPAWPGFAEHYAYRQIVGPDGRPAAPDQALAFLRERDARQPLDAPAISGLLDAYPAVCARGSEGAKITTVSFAAQYFPTAADDASDEPLFLRARTITQHEGYAVEFRELWARERLVALNQQTFAVLG